MCSHVSTRMNVFPSPHRQGHTKGLNRGGLGSLKSRRERERKRAIADNTLCDCQKRSQCVQGARLWSFALAAVLWPAFT